MQNKKLDVEPQYRGFQIERAGLNEEARTVELSFSSEQPYERWFGIEILDHNERSIDLTRLKSGGALLMDHDPRDQIGVVESVSVGKDRRGRAVVRFGNSQRANEMFQDVKDGIRTNVSVGYEIHEMTLESQKSGDTEVYRVNKWTPFEVSLVAIPADPTVGVNRAESNKTNSVIINSKESEMTTETEVKPTAPAVDLNAVRSQAAQQEASRVRELLSVGDQFNAMDMARECLNEGLTVDVLRQRILEKRTGEKLVKAESPDIGLSAKEVRSYSMARILNALANPNDKRAQESAAFEFEASSAACKRTGKDTKGAMVPYEILTRDLNVGTAIDGGNLVSTDLLSGSFIQSLENALALRQCGATMLSGLNGNIAIPRQTGGASHYWLAENGAPTESGATFDQIALTPKTVGAYTEISRKLLQQSSISTEAFVQNELAMRLALAIDYAGINGSGTSNQPKGIMGYAGIGSVVGGANGAAPDWADIVNLETAAAAANALTQNMCYLTNAKVRGKLKQTEKASSTAQFIWDMSNSVNGYKTVVSNQVPSTLVKGTSGATASAIIFGNFADLIIGMWGGLDLQVNPYSLDTTGAVRITAFQDVDMNLRHPESFAVMADALTV